MRIITNPLLLFSMLFITSAFSTVEDTDTYVGYAYAKGSPDLIYTEEFTDVFRNGKPVESRTRYFDPEGVLIARRTLDFSHSLYAPDFQTEDLRTGYMEGAEVKAGKVRLFVKKNRGATVAEKTLSVPQPVVIDGGFNQYIKSNWEALRSGKALVFHFTVSSKLDYYTLRAESVGMKDDTMTIRIAPDKTLLRWIADPILIRYDVRTKRIKSYEGKSNIADAHGTNFIARLIYPKKGP